jgi:protein gp37
MSFESKIEWTQATWNPTTGCDKISPGCAHCYAETFAERWRGVPGHPYEQGFDLKLWSERLALPLSWKKPRIIFVNSMSDLFHDQVPDDFIHLTFDAMRVAGHHQFQLLTKRPARMLEFSKQLRDWPANVWAGVSVESQAWEWRIDLLKQVKAKVRFLSCEPLLGPLQLSLVGLHWVIVGGESGFGARSMSPEWIRDIRDQCQLARVPFFFKQWGGVQKKRAGRLLDERTWDELPDIDLSSYFPTQPASKKAPKLVASYA